MSNSYQKRRSFIPCRDIVHPVFTCKGKPIATRTTPIKVSPNKNNQKESNELSKNKDFSYFGVRKIWCCSDLTNSQYIGDHFYPHMDDIIRYFEYKKRIQKVTYQYKLIIHQVPNISPSIPSVVSHQQLFHSVSLKDRKQHAPQKNVTMTMDILITPHISTIKYTKKPYNTMRTQTNRKCDIVFLGLQWTRTSTAF